MSRQIPTHFVKQFNKNVMQLSQQKGSRLRKAVRVESQNGDESFFDRIDETEAVEKVGRHADTPQIDTPHDRRRVTMRDYHWNDYIDKEDKLRTLYDPANPYAVAASYAMGRKMDDVLIKAVTGTAYSDVDGGTPVELANSRKLVATNGSSLSGLNVLTLRNIKEKIDEEDVDEDEPRYIAYSAADVNSLLGDTNLTSADYNTVKALAHGHIDTFMGFKFIRTQRLQDTATAVRYTADGSVVATGGSGLASGNGRKCFAWTKMGLLLSLGKEPTTRVDERADKSYATQVYACMSIGAVRMEEARVVEVIVNK